MRRPESGRVPLAILAVLVLASLAILPLNWRANAVSCAREEPAYVGSKSCRKCHFKEYKDWSKTKMALAFETLKPGKAAEAKLKAKLDPAKDYSRDATCVACHTTGYGKPGGYPALVEGKAWTAEETARATLMEGVGCETCHGPGEKSSPYKKDHKEYKWADVAALGAVHPAAAMCTTCHNEKSPSFTEFDFEKKVTQDTHVFHPMKKEHGCDHTHRAAK